MAEQFLAGAHAQLHQAGMADDLGEMGGTLITTATVLEPYPRIVCQTTKTPTSNTAYLSFFRAQKSLASVAKLYVYCGGTAASGITHAILGIYTADAAGNASSLLAQTTDDTSLFSVAGSQYVETLGSSISIVAGSYYAFCLYMVATTMPAVVFCNAGNGNATLNNSFAPYLSRSVASAGYNGTLPASIPAGSSAGASGNGLFYVVLSQ